MPNKKKILVVSFQSLTANSAGGMARLGYYLSEELHKRGLLQKFIVHSKGKYETSFPSEPVSKWSRAYLFALNKWSAKAKVPAHKFRLIQENIFDWFCAKQLSNKTGILFTTNAHMRRTFAKAKKKGIPIIYIPANQEENLIYELVTHEHDKMHLDTIDAYTYLPRLKFYNDSIKYVDTVIGTYPTVYNSYVKAGSNLYNVVQITGHLKPDFKPYEMEARPESKVFRVGYLAHTVVLKGLQYLLEAWEDLMKEHKGEPIELNVAGYIEPKLKAYIDKRFEGLAQVNYLGRIPDVPDFFKNTELFVVSSLAEGGPYTALEAALYGVPVLITDNCGSAELLGRNESGCEVIPIQDPKSIKEKIHYFYKHKDVAKQMGLNAKRNLDGYSMDHLFVDIADYLEKELAGIK